MVRARPLPGDLMNRGRSKLHTSPQGAFFGFSKFETRWGLGWRLSQGISQGIPSQCLLWSLLFYMLNFAVHNIENIWLLFSQKNGRLQLKPVSRLLKFFKKMWSKKKVNAIVNHTKSCVIHCCTNSQSSSHVQKVGGWVYYMKPAQLPLPLHAVTPITLKGLWFKKNYIQVCIFK